MSCMADPSGDEDQSPARDIIAAVSYNCYSDGSPNANNQTIPAHLHGFGPPGPEIYNLISSGMDNMVGLLPKNHHTPEEPNGAVSWKGSFFVRQGPSPKDQAVNHDSGFYPQHDLTELLDQSSLSSCVFPCEGNERPSHGLSLSLNPFDPSSIGLQSFELRQPQQPDNDLFRFRPSSSRSVRGHNMQKQAFIRSSRYLGPAQELLREFCDLGSKQDSGGSGQKMKGVQKDSDEWGESENAVKRQSLYSLDLLELQRRKSKLLHMLEEVERRYKHYCDQMRAVTSSFESVAGSGTATAYSTLASKAMSRHFRRLKDGILDQIKATKKAMGEKDSAAPGTVKGETPRLRILDQAIRQQRALQQMGNMEIHPWRPQRGLPERSVSVLRAWLFEHFLHPYPSDVDKHILARQTGLSRSQVSNWFINARVRLWKPMVEEMYLEELKDGDQNEGPPDNHNHPGLEDQKPSPNRLSRLDPESLSSIIHHPNDIARNKQTLRNQEFGRVGGDSFGFGFPLYGDLSPQSGVSLTLGLHQHGAGVSLPFCASSQSALFYGREHGMEECPPAEYSSLLDGESQNPPYRNMMGAQLLHDLAG